MRSVQPRVCIKALVVVVVNNVGNDGRHDEGNGRARPRALTITGVNLVFNFF